MIAIAITAGRLYRVRGLGLDLPIIAGHACDAINSALESFIATHPPRQNGGLFHN